MSKSDIEEVLGLAEEAANQALPKDEQVSNLSTNVEALKELRTRIENGEKLLKELKAQEQALSRETIPSIMDELGVASITLSSGEKVQCRPFYSGKIKPESEDRAFDWVEEHGHGATIKGQLIVPYKRDERDEALAVQASLMEDGWEPTVKLSIHHSTFRGLLKELVENEGVTPPPDLFDLFIGRNTIIK